MSIIRALIIDDDKAVRMITSCAMPCRGVHVLIAANTAEADAILQSETVDIIVCDVLMDDEDGLSYCKRLRESGNTTPLVFLSVLDDTITVSIGMSSGAAAFIPKPFDVGELCDQLIKLLAPSAPIPHAV